jgi:hypothetical protein
MKRAESETQLQTVPFAWCSSRLTHVCPSSFFRSGATCMSTLQDAAGTAGVGERTLRRWLRQPNFSRAYLECRREAVGQATARLQQAAGEAVSALEAVMRSPKASPASRVTAARSILDLAYRAAEAEDITQRMAELETTLAGYQRVLAERGLL